jgi:hypothetical protein
MARVLARKEFESTWMDSRLRAAANSFGRVMMHNIQETS